MVIHGNDISSNSILLGDHSHGSAINYLLGTTLINVLQFFNLLL